jgi:serine/threonine protein kinase
MKDRRWKIADFGISAEGTSRRARTTHYARGTSSYRAPEVLRESSTFNNKVDIWALGCILYELVAHKLAFSGDWGVMAYAYSSSNANLDLPEFSSAYTEQSKCVLAALLRAMLQVDENSRPSAKSIVEALSASIDNGRVWLSGCKHGHNKLLSDHMEYKGSSHNYIDLDAEDKRWRAVHWVRHWYRPCIFTG